MMSSRKMVRLVRYFLLAVIICCLILVGREWYLSARHRAQRDEIKEKIEQAENYANAGETEPESSLDETEPESGETLPQDGAEVTGQENGTGGTVPEDADGNGEDAAENDGDGENADGNDGNAGMNDEDADMDGEGGQQEAPHPPMLRKYAALHRENEHFVGWLLIDGTGIDYPVMQCEDDEYYLHHDFYGEDSKYGCLYVRQRADLEAGTNFVIYGHNMRDGAMFGNLDYYLKESFYREHPMISFDTLYEERVYEIVAVFRSQVYNADDDVFKYYQFYEAETVEEFEEFYTNIKALSIYDTGVEAKFGDTFLTCSTCAYHVDDGRLVVVAKRVE